MECKNNKFLDDINGYFKKNGAWEQNKGREQTESFVRYFDQYLSFNDEPFTLLDAGCALGQAAVFFARRYPNAVVSATDVSDVAIERCREESGDSVHFFAADIEEIEGLYDVIYCSNVMEHFYDFKVKSRKLAARCQRLCLMLPYDERTRKGQKLTPDPSSLEHQYSFYKESFDFLLEEKRCVSIRTHIVSCPGAWGWSRRQHITHALDNIFRKICGRPRVHEMLQIIFDIRIK